MVHAIFHESAARSGQCCLGFCLVGSLIAGEPWELMNMSKRKPVSSLSPVQISMRDGIMVQEIAPEQSPKKRDWLPAAVIFAPFFHILTSNPVDRMQRVWTKGDPQRGTVWAKALIFSAYFGFVVHLDDLDIRCLESGPLEELWGLGLEATYEPILFWQRAHAIPCTLICDPVAGKQHINT